MKSFGFTSGHAEPAGRDAAGLDQRRALTPMNLATGRDEKVLNLRNSVTLGIATGHHSLPQVLAVDRFDGRSDSSATFSHMPLEQGEGQDRAHREHMQCLFAQVAQAKALGVTPCQRRNTGLWSWDLNP
jgi:hypothetical protein